MKPAFLHYLTQLNPTLSLKLETRLPEHLIGPCLLTCHWHLETTTDQPILALALEGDLSIVCQRCAQPVNLPFHHENKIALCNNQATLDRLMPEMDCLLMEELPSSLEELVIDELFLYAPDRHPNTCVS